MASGVPALLDPAADPAPQPLMTSDSPAIQPTSRVPAWGIYLNGQIAIEADSILKVEIKESARISNAPQEKGAFQAYNKIQAPFENRVQMTKGGNESERAAFLVALQAAKQSLNLYDIVMPEMSYLNANIIGFSLVRTARSGVTLLTVEVMFEEVRQASAPVFTTTAGGGALTQSPVVQPKRPEGADPVNTGTQQPTTPTPAQAAPARALAPAIAADAPTSGNKTIDGTPMPEGYTQDPQTGVIRDPQGRVDRDLMARDMGLQPGDYPPGQPSPYVHPSGG